MVSITSIGIFGVMFLIALSLISFVGNYNTNRVQEAFAKINCQMPLYHGKDFLNGTIDYASNLGTYYQCFYCFNCVPQQIGTTASYVDFTATAFNAFPQGWFTYIGDSITILFFKINGVEAVLGTVLNPASFTVSGFTVSNISAFGQIVVFSMYIICYVAIGGWSYKTLSPWADG